MLRSTKKKLLLTMIIITIFFIIVSCLSYTGVLRLCKIKLFSCKQVFNKNLPKINEKIYVIITPNSKKECCDVRLRRIINAMLDQEIQVDSIILMLPHSTTYSVPEHLKPFVRVQYINDSYCSEYRGFIQGLLQTVDANAYIVHINDDIIYGKDYILNSIVEMRQNKNTVLLGNKNNIICKADHFSYEKDFRKLTKENLDQFLTDGVNTKRIEHYDFPFSV